MTFLIGRLTLALIIDSFNVKNIWNQFCINVFQFDLLLKSIGVTVRFVDIENHLVLWVFGNAETPINELMLYWNTNKTTLHSRLIIKQIAKESEHNTLKI